MRARWIPAVLALALSAPAVAADSTAVGTVDELHARFIAVMRQADSLAGVRPSGISGASMVGTYVKPSRRGKPVKWIVCANPLLGL